MNTTDSAAGIYRRCGCIDSAGRRIGRRCWRLADRNHGSWYFAAQVTTVGRRVRERRGGYASAQAARVARRAVLATADAGRRWTVPSGCGSG